MSKHDETYHTFLRHIQAQGVHKGDRTGTGTQSVFGYQMRFDLADGFPLLTTKKVHLKSIIHELLWFIKGSTNIQYLRENGVTIWDEWADENGDLGPVYGHQWRSWPTYDPVSWFVDDDGDERVDAVVKPFDQLQHIITQLRQSPDSRRIVVSAWNVGEVEHMKLPPCHLLFQFYSRPTNQGRFLDVQLYQRSADAFLGVPFNIASYALLLLMVAQVTGHKPGELVWTGGDCHIYANHREQVLTQLSREPREAPEVGLRPRAEIDDFVYEDFVLAGYDPHPGIKAPVAV